MRTKRKKSKKSKKSKRTSQNRLWAAAIFYRAEAEKCQKARAYFSTVVARGCELEALLRIFDFVETRKPRKRCRDLFSLINRAFKKHWIPHDALRHWKKTERISLKRCLHELRESRNGVHAHLFKKDLATRHAAINIGFLVQSMYSFLEIKNARNLMHGLYGAGKISKSEYNAWKRKQDP